MRIRSVAEHDVDAVVAFWDDVLPGYRDPARPHREPRANALRKLAFGDELFWVAERDERIVGTVMAGYEAIAAGSTRSRSIPGRAEHASGAPFCRGRNAL